MCKRCLDKHIIYKISSRKGKCVYVQNISMNLKTWISLIMWLLFLARALPFTIMNHLLLEKTQKETCGKHFQSMQRSKYLNFCTNLPNQTIAIEPSLTWNELRCEQHPYSTPCIIVVIIVISVNVKTRKKKKVVMVTHTCWTICGGGTY